MALRFQDRLDLSRGKPRLLAPPSVLRHHSSPPLPSRPLSKSTGAHRDQQGLMCLVSTFLSHHHSLGTLCENEGLECPDAKTFGT